jgi:hypothetical protein
VLSLVDLVESVRAIPYGRPTDRTVAGMLREKRGTCSTKHLFLYTELRDRFPETQPRIVHRVYRIDRPSAATRFGEAAASAVPPTGLVDVHRYLTILVDGQRIVIDATFPGPPWDGRSSMPLSCGDGIDYEAGSEPDDDKRRLEALHCTPALREPFIAALSKK